MDMKFLVEKTFSFSILNISLSSGLHIFWEICCTYCLCSSTSFFSGYLRFSLFSLVLSNLVMKYLGVIWVCVFILLEVYQGSWICKMEFPSNLESLQILFLHFFSGTLPSFYGILSIVRLFDIVQQVTESPFISSSLTGLWIPPG